MEVDHVLLYMIMIASWGAVHCVCVIYVLSGTQGLLEQPDFLVVGVVGLQGSGKSTLLSLLAGNTPSDPHR